jgi:hypothetical protein
LIYYRLDPKQVIKPGMVRNVNQWDEKQRNTNMANNNSIDLIVGV